jgi:hypothetical protein
VTLDTARFLQNTDNQPQQYDESGWRQIRTGLLVVAIGYGVLILGSITSGALVRLAISGKYLPSPGEEQDLQNLYAWLTASSLVVTAICSYSLVMLGQFRCMMYAPPQHCAKEVMYICCQCLLAAAVLNGLGVFLDEGKSFAALKDGWHGVKILNPWSVANSMHLASFVLGVISTLVFSQYLRRVAERFDDSRGAKAVDLNLIFTALIIGGSVGAGLCMGGLKLKGVTLVLPAAAWLSCLIWHLWLVLRIRRCVYDGLRKASEERTPILPTGTMHTSTLSGLHRRVSQTATEGEGAWLW